MKTTFPAFARKYLFLLIITVFAVVASYVIFIPFGPHGLTTTVYTDESFGFKSALYMLENRTISTRHFYDWGPCYFYLEAASFMVFNLGASIVGFDVSAYADYQPYAVVGRFLSLLFAAGALGVFYLYVNRIFGWPTAIVALLFTVTMAVILQMSALLRPDTANLFFEVAALSAAALSLTERPRLVYIAAVLAGLSFTVKYTGLTLLPFIGAAAVAPYVTGESTVRERLRKGAIELVKVVSIFTVAVIISAPIIVLDLAGFLKGVYHVSVITSSGMLFEYSANPLAWLPKLLSGLQGGPVLPVVFVFFCIGACIWAAWTMRRDFVKRFLLTPEVLPIAWAFSYFLFFFFFVHNRSPRYIVPVLPFFALAAAAALRKGWCFWKIPRIIIVVFVAFIVAWNGAHLYGFTNDWAQKAEDSRNVGQWFETYVTRRDVVGRFWDVYIPRGMYKMVFINSEDDLLALRPAAFITDRPSILRFQNPERAEKYRRGREAYLELHKLFKRLQAGEVPGYYKAAEYGRFVIFAREDIGPGSDTG